VPESSALEGGELYKGMRDRKIKLAQITHDLRIGGLQQVVVNLCRTIDRERFDIIVICLRALGAFVPEVERMGIKVKLVPQKQNGTDYFSFLKLANILKEEKIEVIHTHNTQPFFDGTIAGLLAGVKTIIHTDHARNFPDKRRYMFAEWLVSHFAYKIVGVSDHTCHNLVYYEKIPENKIITIMNGIDLTRYKIEIDRQKKRAELGLNRKGPIIGLAVRLVEAKGVRYLLEAMTDVVPLFPDITLLIAGDGPLQDELKKMSVALGIEERVLFTGSRLDIPELLKLFDIYVLPSVSEGLPMVLLEAMAAGCPIIATEVGGVPMAIHDGQNGSLVKPKDPKALSSEIMRLLSNKDVGKRYSENAVRLAQEKFSAEAMTRSYERLYLRIN
jgi:glycosyltransferase involved in cell wall biosynthesis